MNNLILGIVVASVAVATVEDIRKREVPDWLNYGLVAFGLGANALQSIALWDFAPMLYSIAGLLVFFAIAYVMFYTGQWGGGDSKMLIGMGAAIGLPFSLVFPFIDFGSFMVAFWLNLLLAGVAYALGWAVFAALRSRKKFLAEARQLLKRQRRMRRIALAVALALIIASFFPKEPIQRMLLAIIAVMLVLVLYLSVFSRAVENSSMLRRVKPSELTEGDWIAKDIVLNGKTMAGPKDLGISKRQIARLEKLWKQRKIRTVLIKVGIPFVPSFFAALLITLLYGNLFVLVLNAF